jgi:glycogen(starch) synthase
MRVMWPRRKAPRPLRVSVVINTLNRRESLRRALVGLSEQTYPHFELVVVNGPSTDGTEEMVDAFDGPIRLARCPEANLGRSRNVGVGVAAGDVVAFLDDDAEPEPEWLTEIVARYDDPNIAGVGGPVFDVPLGQVVWDLCTCTRLGQPETSSEGPPSRYVGAGADPFLYLPGANMSFRRSALARVGGFNGLLRHNYDDAEVCARVIDAGYGLTVLEDALVRHARAPNPARDENPDDIVDPYLTIYCHAIFAMQCESAWPVERAAEAVSQSAAGMTRIAEQTRAQGRFDDARCARFAARAQNAVRDGISDGSRPREFVTIGPARSQDFIRYRKIAPG